MEIEQHLWGMTPDGEAIIRYTLRAADGAEVRLSNLGAGVVGIRMPDRCGELAEVALGYRDCMDYMNDPASCGKTLGRVADRIAYGRLTVDGTDYRLEINHGANHLNGGTKGFANRLWESRVEGNRVVMSLASEAGDQGYPGALWVEVAFDFDDDHALEITYAARAEAATPVDLSCALYLNLAGEGSGTIADHRLQLNTSKVLELNENRVPTGVQLEVAGTPADFTAPRCLGDGIDADWNRMAMLGGYDHPMVLDGWRRNILAEAGRLSDPASGRTVQLLTSQPCVVLNTANRLSGGSPASISGQPYGDRAGVALICQNLPDAVHHDSFPSPILRPGELYCQKTVWRFGVE